MTDLELFAFVILPMVIAIAAVIFTIVYTKLYL